MKKILLFIFLMIMFVSNAKAEACDAYDIKRLKEIANGVEVTYELQEPFEDSYGDVVKDSYVIYISGLGPDFNIKFIDKEREIVNFEKNDILNNDVVSINNWLSGNYRIDIYSKTCNVLLNNINVTLPKYNYYYESSICNKYKGKIEVCDKWYSFPIDENIINSEIEKYEANNKNFIEKNLVFIITGLMLIIIFVIYKVISRRREVLS